MAHRLIPKTETALSDVAAYCDSNVSRFVPQNAAVAAEEHADPGCLAERTGTGMASSSPLHVLDAEDKGHTRS